MAYLAIPPSGGTTLTETSGPTTLTIGAIPDTSIPFRSGTTFIGSSDLTYTASTDLTVSSRLRVVASKTIASAASATWNGIDWAASTLTITGSTNITTAAGVNAHVFRAPTLTSSSALTVTFATTVTILAAPSAGGSTTISNAYALWVQAGTSNFAGKVEVVNDLDILPGGVRRFLVSSAGATGSSAANGNLILDSTTNSTKGRVQLGSTSNVVVGDGALATTATDGFLYIPSCAGAPTGVPTAFSGRVPLVYDSTNNRIYVYDGAWLNAAVA